MQILIDIPHELSDKILWFLEAFKDKGLRIVANETVKKDEKLSDEDIEKHWREIIMNTPSNPNYYKSEEYKIDRGEYLMEKYK
ncbi:MAG: hypothetical protein IE878_01675 [Epsilonproteobacteria bacterium]|nr:hypothetical protein [Campylobacterota bacterium]